MKTNKFLWLIGVIISTAACAQVNLTNTGVLKLSTGSDILYVNGNFTNNSTASLTNNGQIYIKQNLTNDQASMTAGTGTLYLNGTSGQTVSGSQIFKTWNFVSNNSNGITLNNDLSIGGAHTFTAGLITSSSTPNYLVYEAGSSYSGDGDTKHVNGWVKKYGSTNFTFPVGDATYERTVALESLAGSSEFNVRYNTPTPNYTQVQFPIITMDRYEYWQINQVSGGSASVHLNWDNSKVSFYNYAVADIVVAYYNGSNWINVGGTAVGNASATGDVTSNSVSSFGNFGFGSKSFPLPVNFLNFSASRKNGYTELKWTTAQEINIDHYDIQRSETSAGFTTIASTPSLNRQSTQEYSYNDRTPINKIAYYRIFSVGKDGTTKFSRTVAVYDNSFLTSNLQILNPAKKYVTVRSKKDDPSATIILTSTTGQEILKTVMPISAGIDNQIAVPDRISEGMYFIKISGTNTNYSGKIFLY